ncbi:LCP family protein required for cell wall assembly [Cytobacillus eiseniae]|uniref:LCP family protein required for cell wall assembly n=1 Tax=Cytobacillus eiseniae TaxID=762947 RepID=A0ABS4RJH7_9BACI|nr:LCP family protein [Cytobacillus eiseniae]MBP2241967.1 LCP family protein required for cell wall assembly [Cytobacillus eiseniae]
MSNLRSQRRKSKKKRFWRSFILLVLLLLVGGGSYFAFDIAYHAKNASDNIYQEIDREKVENHRTEEVKITKEPFNILLLGIEEQGGGQRSDVLLLVTVNPVTEEISMLSIPRDTRIMVPAANRKTKITESFSYGGVESTIETIDELLDVPIDYYITTNFEGFEDIVDTLGGVEVDVPFTFKSQLTGSLKWKTFTEGPMELNGNEALAYVRMRKKDPEGDKGRNERQREVIKAIIDKGASVSTIPKINDILGDLGENVKTNIPPSELINFVKLYTKIKNSEIQNLTLEGKDQYINGGSYFIADEDSIEELSTFLNDSLTNTKKVKVTNNNSSQNSEVNTDNKDW